MADDTKQDGELEALVNALQFPATREIYVKGLTTKPVDTAVNALINLHKQNNHVARAAIETLLMHDRSANILAKLVSNPKTPEITRTALDVLGVIPDLDRFGHSTALSGAFQDASRPAQEEIIRTLGKDLLANRDTDGQRKVSPEYLAETLGAIFATARSSQGKYELLKTGKFAEVTGELYKIARNQPSEAHTRWINTTINTIGHINPDHSAEILADIPFTTALADKGYKNTIMAIFENATGAAHRSMLPALYRSGTIEANEFVDRMETLDGHEMASTLIKTFDLHNNPTHPTLGFFANLNRRYADSILHMATTSLLANGKPAAAVKFLGHTAAKDESFVPDIHRVYNDVGLQREFTTTYSQLCKELRIESQLPKQSIGTKIKHALHLD